MTRASEVRRTPHARCLVTLITAGLLAGYAAMYSGQLVAEARNAESIAPSGATGGVVANIALPIAHLDSVADPRLQSDTETLDEGAPSPAASSPPSSNGDVET